jgi:maleylacetoacetate isomerase
MQLHSYFRSSAAYRVRIALQLKGLAHEVLPVHLLRGGGEQRSADYLALNPAGLVPTLVDDTTVLHQSLAIIEYLDEKWPAVPLLPSDLAGRARVRALAQTIACDLHPLNNLRVLQYLTQTLGATAEQKSAWYTHWVQQGLHTLEALLAHSPDTGLCCHHDQPGLADACLVPQVFNAERFGIALDAYPTVQRITAHCRSLPAFERAAPQAQPDAEG